MPTDAPAERIRACFYAFFPGGGIGRYTRELAKELGKRPDIEVEVACSPDFEWQDEDGYRSWPGLQTLSHRNPLIRKTRFLTGQFVSPRRLARHLASGEVDVLHFSNVNNLTFPFWRHRIARSGVPTVISVHDIQREKPILNRKWEDRQLKAVYRFADALFVHSKCQADELHKWADVPQDRIHVVPHGPYPHGSVTVDRNSLRRSLGIPQEANVGLFFGQIRDEKNLDGLLRAMAGGTESIHLIIAGRGNPRHREVTYYRRLANELNIEDRVTFLERFVDDEEVPDLFSTADWVALPYMESFTSQSGVLNVAAHYERPVLVSSAPVLKETVKSCDIGVACDGDSPGAIRRGMSSMQQRVATGYEHAFADYRRRYSWQANAAKTAGVYALLVAAKEQHQVMRETRREPSIKNA